MAWLVPPARPKPLRRGEGPAIHALLCGQGVDPRDHRRAKRRRPLDGYGERREAVLRTAMRGHDRGDWRNFCENCSSVSRLAEDHTLEMFCQGSGACFPIAAIWHALFNCLAEITFVYRNS